MEGFLVAPGYIELSKLRFFTVGTADFVVDDDQVNKRNDDIYQKDTEGDDNSLNEEGGGRRRERMLDQEQQQQPDYGMEGSAVDLAVFQLVSPNKRRTILRWDWKPP